MANDSGKDFTLEKSLPSNVEAERMILGVILLDNMTVNQAVEILKPDDFFLPSHRRIFDKIVKLYEQGQGIDPLTLQEELRRAGELDQVGGPAYIASLFDGVPRFSNIESYTRIVKGKSMLRKLIGASNQVMQMAFDDEDEPEEVLDRAERLILSIAEDRIKQGFVHIGEVAEKQLHVIEEVAAHQQLITGVATGFTDLDYMTSGMQRGDLVIVAARPSMGKCLVADTEIVIANGEVVTIEEIYRRRQARLLTLGDDFRFKLTEPSAFVDDGLKPVYRVTTSLGRSVDSTITHPFLTVDGWKRLAELKVGERIAVPRRLEIFGSKWLHECELEALARNLCDKAIPPIVFELTKPQLALFLDHFIALNDWTARNERQAQQMQHLFLRFGVVAKLYCNNEGTWQFFVPEAQRILAGGEATGDNTRKSSSPRGAIDQGCSAAPPEPAPGANVVPVVSPPANLRCPSGTKSYFQDCVESNEYPHRPGFAEAFGRRHVLAQSDIYWDEIISFKYLGDRQVYDLTIPETHNFVANDICVHNTAFALNIAQNAALGQDSSGRLHEDRQKAVVGVFSLEMSKEQLVQRLMCSQAQVDAHRLRSGMLNKEDWRRLALAVGELSQADIFLDDTPGITTLEVRAKSRRLKNEQKRLDLLIIDYLQLMSGKGRTESRQQEVSQISRELKILAKELNVPLIALSQLSRAPETRTGNHKPQLSDLRESGCLAGESLVVLADSGAHVPIRELVGQSGFAVWALNEVTMQLERAVVSRAFATGVKPVFKLTTRLGREIRATANHKFRGLTGWKRLDELGIGERLALPRIIPSVAQQTMTDAELALLGHLIGDGCTLPRHAIQYTTREKDLAEMVAELARTVFGNEVEPRIHPERNWYQVYLSSTRHHTHGVRSAVTNWLSELGVWGLRSYEKHVPEKVFTQSAAAIGIFLRHLWATDGCIRLKPGFYAPAVYYASSSERLTRDVQSLLLRLGINAWLRRRSQNGKGRDQFHVSLTGKADLENFANTVGAVGEYKRQSLQSVSDYLRDRQSKTNRDVIPSDVWREVVVPAMQDAGLTTRQMMAGIRNAYCGTGIYSQNISRERAARIAEVIQSDSLARLACSDVYWDQVVSIESDGEADVYDLTVPGLQNFVAQGFIPHNSIEQDADVVMFIYREEVYKPETEKQNIAEIIIGKQRNGPIGSVELVFRKALTRFHDISREGM